MFQEPIAPYLAAAYAVFLGGMLFYFLSLKIRHANARREADAIRQIAEEMEKEAAKNKK